MKQFHYVYQITNSIEQKHYIGVRSCTCTPKEDLGVKYFSSSCDKSFMQAQKESPDNFIYEILEIFSNREAAVQKEIELHEKFNIGINPLFYNRSKQTSVGFDTTGTVSKPFSAEHRRKISECHKGKIISETHRQKLREINTGKKLSAETKNKIGESCTGEKHYRYGKTLSDTVKRKISNALIGKKSGEQNPMYGKTQSDEIKRKMSEARTNKKHSADTKRKIRESLIGENNPNAKSCVVNGITYPAVAAAVIATGIPHSTLRQRINSSSPNFKNYFYT